VAVIGILPGEDRAHANPWVSIALPTGLGELRNGLIVRAADVAIAVGGAYGTLSEIALAMVADVPVIGIDSWDVEGGAGRGIAAGSGPPRAGAVRGRRRRGPLLDWLPVPTFKSAYLIHGDDHGRISERRARLRALAESLSGTEGLELLEGEEATPDAVARALDAMTLALGRRFVIVEGVERWKDKELDALDAAEAHEAGQLDADFHLTIYEASGSELLSVLRGYWNRLQLELSERVYNTEVPRRFLDEHLAILEALKQGDPPLVEQRMKQHIEHGRSVLAKALAR